MAPGKRPVMATSAPAATVVPVSTAPPTLTTNGLGFVVPASWVRGEVADGMGQMGRVAQYEIPGEGGPAEAIFYHFGVGQGGNVASNIVRWRGQFAPEDGRDIQQRLETLQIGDLKVTTVSLAGKFSPMMMGSPSTAAGPKPAWMMRGIIVEGGAEGSIFVKITGPRATLEPRQAELDTLERSVRVVP